jgi:hypothetical protein
MLLANETQVWFGAVIGGWNSGLNASGGIGPIVDGTSNVSVPEFVS